ncbi:MAG: alpha/beta hydrolase [Anaerolineales bacterium]|nr:alpha/beta hydrolase [Anaerolineales bacterium]
MTASHLTLRLSDGRILACAEYGALQGRPVIFFHGLPGSRVFRPPDRITAQQNVRLICCDRPGFGLSTFQPDRRILDWPADIAQLADFLNLDRFAVCGHSGGGPYLLACAHALPDRVTALASLCGVGPLDARGAIAGMEPVNQMGFRLGRCIPWPLWWLLNWAFYRRGHRDPLAIMERGQKSRPPADQLLWDQPEVREVCLRSTSEGLRQGTRGQAWEARLLCRPWGFDLTEIRTSVQLWYGEADNLVPPGMGRHLAACIPGARLTLLPDEGHLLLFKHWGAILSQLTRG